MAIKKLQNDFTTPEQSKRLLELGVPAWTADCFFYEEGGISKDCTPNIVPLGEVWTDESEETMFSSYVDVPCWSVGRLIEICLKCSTLEQRQIRFFCNGDDDEYSLIDHVVTALESGVMTNHMDFSKLED